MHQKDQPIMDLSASKQNHHPYRRGERRRKPLVAEQAVHPVRAKPVRGDVLLVEPEAPLRWLLHHVLAEQGYAVIEAATAAQAMTLLEQKTFALLLLDVDLPDDTGWKLLRALAVSLPLAPPLLILPKHHQALEHTDTAPPGAGLLEPSWLADLLRLVERLRSAPGPPAGSAKEDARA
jgi:CheY-like chemotaxis protein